MRVKAGALARILLRDRPNRMERRRDGKRERGWGEGRREEGREGERDKEEREFSNSLTPSVLGSLPTAIWRSRESGSCQLKELDTSAVQSGSRPGNSLKCH